MSTPNSVIQPLQEVQNFSVRLILMAPHHHHFMALLQKLHWLPIPGCIKYKVACMRCNAVDGSGPTYLSESQHIDQHSVLHASLFF